MKFRNLWVAAIVALSLPAVLDAQSSGTASFATLSRPYKATGFGSTPGGGVESGGGFNVSGTMTLGSQTINLSNYILWCIDPTRSVASDVKNFTVYSFAEFANTAFGPKPNDVVYDPTLNDMNSIGSHLATFEGRASTNWVDNTYSPTNNAVLGSIYNDFTGGWFGATGGPTGDTSYNATGNGWYVLYNGQQQTFAIRVPVPENGTLVLMFTAMMGMALVARRRYA